MPRWNIKTSRLELSFGAVVSAGAARMIGTRVIVAISLEPHEVVAIDFHAGGREERRYETNDPSWHNGPPYPIVEHVFDEDGIEDCSMVPEEHGS